MQKRAPSLDGDFLSGGEWRIDFSGGHACGQVETCEPGRSFRTTYRQGIDAATAESHHIEVGMGDYTAAQLVHRRRSSPTTCSRP